MRCRLLSKGQRQPQILDWESPFLAAQFLTGHCDLLFITPNWKCHRFHHIFPQSGSLSKQIQNVLARLKLLWLGLDENCDHWWKKGLWSRFATAISRGCATATERARLKAPPFSRGCLRTATKGPSTSAPGGRRGGGPLAAVLVANRDKRPPQVFEKKIEFFFSNF